MPLDLYPIKDRLAYAASSEFFVHAHTDTRALVAEVEMLRTRLGNLMAWGVEHDDPRIDYVTVQVDRVSIDAARAALGLDDE